MNLLSLSGHNHTTPNELPDDDFVLYDDPDFSENQDRPVLDKWLLRRKIERLQEQKRLRQLLEDYQHFTVDMVNDREN